MAFMFLMLSSDEHSNCEPIVSATHHFNEPRGYSKSTILEPPNPTTNLQCKPRHPPLSEDAKLSINIARRPIDILVLAQCPTTPSPNSGHETTDMPNITDHPRADADPIVTKSPLQQPHLRMGHCRTPLVVYYSMCCRLPAPHGHQMQVLLDR
jgi:hypothetical protein